MELGFWGLGFLREDGMSDTMLAAILYGKEDVRLEQIPIPRADTGEVVVRIENALTCGTDLKVYQRGYHARMIQPPSVFGHEFAGVVAEVGGRVEGWKIGDRVVAANSAPCGACYYCQREQENLCDDLVWLNGAYAQFIKVPPRIVEKNLLKIPTSLSFKAAALVEPLACAVRGARDVHLGKDELGGMKDEVIIVGAGPLGLLFLCIAKHAGARMIVVGKGAVRMEAAKRLGADAVIDSSNADWIKAAKSFTDAQKGADIVIEAVGKPETWEAAISLARKGGRVNLFGGCPAGMTARFDTTTLHYGDLTLRSSFHHTPGDVRRALALLEQGVVRAEDFVSDEKPLSELPKLLATMVREKSGVKTAILPPRE